MEGGDLSESVGVVQHWSLRSFGGHMKLKEKKKEVQRHIMYLKTRLFGSL